MNRLYAIDGRYFYAGILVNNSVIVTAAPILRWSIGWEFNNFTRYATKKNWAIIDVETHPLFRF